MMKLFTSNTCVNCGRVKEILNEKGIEYEIKSVNEMANKKELLSKGVMSVPALLIGDEIYTSEKITDNLLDTLK